MQERVAATLRVQVLWEILCFYCCKADSRILSLQGRIGDIRKNYEKDWDDSDMTKRQMAVALYFIDILALRAGHEKDDDEADTVGCCTLKVFSHQPACYCFA